MKPVKFYLEYEIFKIDEFSFTGYTILTILIIFSLTKFLLWLIKKALVLRKKKSRKFDEGNAFALYQIIKYTLWILASTLILETIGIKVTVLIAGSAALLVGVGLGVQQTFNDILSGIILLVEGTIKIGDVLDIDGDVVRIEKIGLRTSVAVNRDEIIVVVPNSLITTNKVINWSHQTDKTRFRIKVGVAYGSDVDLVISLLEKSAYEHAHKLHQNKIEARFVDFGNSSLDFELLFFSREVFRIEKIKSDIRKSINKNFNKHNINIPFPQMDVHLKQ